MLNFFFNAIDKISHVRWSIYLRPAVSVLSKFSHVKKNEIRGNESDRSMARWKEEAAEDSS